VTTDLLTRKLAGVLSAVTYGDLPALVVAEAERSVLDWLGSVLAGSLEPPARFAQKVIARMGASRDATVFSAGRSSAAGAALANGVASHILELDDIHKASTVHAAAAIIPAALAMAEREHADGRAFLRAVVLGYEAALRIGEAVNPSHYRFWHPTGTAATFGAAVAAGSILKLNARQMLDAFGSAGTQAAGLWEFNADGAMSKHLHPGKAAFNGIISADLAREGFTGATRILEGERGFFRAMSESHNPARITEGLGERWKILENCYKLHSCCGHIHTAIDAALDIRNQPCFAADRIARIDIETYGPGWEIVKEQNPRTPYQAKFSLVYCVAAALLEGGIGLDQFSPDRFGEQGVQRTGIAALIGRTRVTVADDLTANYPDAWPARLAVTLGDGTVLRHAADFPRGNPENPVPISVIEEKLVSLVESRFNVETARRALDAARSVETCGDMAEVFCDLLPA